MSDFKRKLAFSVMKNALDFDFLNQQVLKKRFKNRMGYSLDFNTAKTLNEKMQVIKLYDKNPLYTTVADKLRVRKFVEERIGDDHLIPLLQSGVDVNDITLDRLPKEPFIVKVNHDCSGGLIVRDINEKLLNVKEIDVVAYDNAKYSSIADYNLDYIKEFIRRRFQYNHYYPSKEWQYKNIEKSFIIERLLQNSDGTIPNDYKFNCFNGNVEFVYVSAERESRNYRKIYYPDWTEAPFTWTKLGSEKKFNGPEVEKPSNFEEMLEIARKLSQGFKYVRVDLYNCDGRIYFGELTLQHGSGFEPILPKKFDLHYGSLVKL